ncbi:MAG: CBS domain-containing protein [Actinomycetota bacterium]|nr:CBS domain-containing protein [Actinomycetota bacterium]
MRRVREMMVSEVVTIDSWASVADAAKQMIQEEKGTLPIVEGDQLHGMITDRDIIAHVVAEGRDNNSTMVHDIATLDLITVGPDQDVEEVHQLMDQHGLDRLLVVEEGRLVGLISGTDIRSDEGLLP